MAENKIVKYLIYAIGEIALVVIGILIALQIDNWNEERKDRQELKLVLNNIQLNLESDQREIDERMKDAKNTLGFWNLLKKSTDNDSLAELFIKNTTSQFIPVDNASYNSAISRNKLNLIDHPNLKADLISYYEKEMHNAQRFIGYHIAIAQDLTQTAINESIKIKNFKTFGKRMTVVLKDPSFHEMMNSYLRLYDLVLERLHTRKDLAKQLVETIKTELKQ